MGNVIAGVSLLGVVAYIVFSAVVPAVNTYVDGVERRLDNYVYQIEETVGGY